METTVSEVLPVPTLHATQTNCSLQSYQGRHMLHSAIVQNWTYICKSSGFDRNNAPKVLYVFFCLTYLVCNWGLGTSVVFTILVVCGLCLRDAKHGKKLAMIHRSFQQSFRSSSASKGGRGPSGKMFFVARNRNVAGQGNERR